MSHLAISLLGPFAVTLDGEPVTGFVSDKARALLFCLAVEVDCAHRRETLAGLLWPDYPERSARTNLSNALSNLRAIVGDRGAAHTERGAPYLLVTRETIQFNDRADHWVDVTAFDALVDAQRWEEAIALYRGGFLAGFSVADSPPFESWALVVREHLRRQMTVALERLAAEREARCDYAGAQDAARRHLELEPWHEGAHRSLMRCLALEGERGAALAQFEACCRALEQELGVEPALQTARLGEQIRDGQFPPPVAGDAQPGGAARRHNLPAQLTPLIGRKAELARIRELLADPNCRLLTLVGPGGIGKTCLALEAAAEQVYDFEHGVFYVSLAPVRSVEAILPAVAQALGFAFRSSGEPRQQLYSYLRRKEILLVLDNFEHLLAPLVVEGGVDVVTGILEATPAVKVLVTSRARLNLRGEQLLPVVGMACPEEALPMLEAPDLSAVASRYPSVTLFAHGARRARPEFTLTAGNLPHVFHICRLVQGMPLGILLAAAWVEVLSPAEIAREIGKSLDFLETEWRDMPERQRSVRAVFGSMWAMMTAAERAAFARLSVFRGGFTAEAAAAVAGASLHALRGLAHKSFLNRGEAGRYEIHELLRQYAERKLDETPGDREWTCDRHCAYYAQFLDQRRDAFRKRGAGDARPEMANIRAAWSWAIEHARLPDIRRSFEAIFWLLEVRGSQNREKGTLLAQAVDLLRGPKPTGENQLALGLALCYLALSLAMMGPREAASALAQEGLSLLRRLGPGREVALGHILAVVSGVAEDETQAKLLLEQGLAIAQEADGPLETCWALYLLGRVALGHDQYDEAEQHFLTLLRIAREIDHRRGEVRSLRGLGRVAQFRGQYAHARAFFEQELIILRDLEVRAYTLTCLNNLGEVTLASGDLEQAVARYQKALSSSEELAVQEEMARALCGLGAVALATGDLSAARRCHRRALQVALEDKSVDTSRLTLVSVAKLCTHVGEPELAVELVALTLRIRPSFWRDKAYGAGALLGELRSGLSSDAYAAAQERGRARELKATLKELSAELQNEP